MKSFAKIAPVLFILAVTCLIFFKLFLKGLFPIPGDLLVSFYYPWYAGGWEDYNQWTTRKELLNADAIRQIYIWKEFAINEFKNGDLPLWNPHTFSGQPLAANFQSSVYYPLNILYIFLSSKYAWTLLVILQPFLAGIFMYLLARSFKLSKVSSVFASVAFIFSSYVITWIENVNVIHSYMWLPFSFWSINKFFENFKLRFALILTLSYVMAILAGHPQTVIYIYLATFLYWLYKSTAIRKNLFKNQLIFAGSALTSLLVCAIQLIPTYFFYKNSPISLPFSKEVFGWSILPPANLVTFFASDFFGHPAANNFWNFSYGDFTPYIGVVPLIFALWAVKTLWHERFIKFATIVSVAFIMAAIKSPVTYLLSISNIPLLDATTPSRFISISLFLLVILTGFGFSDFLKNINNSKYIRNFLKFLSFIGLIYLLLWIFALVGTTFLKPEDTWTKNLAVTRRNLILPTMMYLSVVAMGIGLLKIQLVRKFGLGITILGVFSLTILGGIYFSNKFLPVAPKSFIYPEHPVFTYLKENGGINRFYGGETAHVDFNISTQYQVYAVEGYDTLRDIRYAELMASTQTGKVPKTYLRSDAVVPNIENKLRKRVFDILGVKYLLDKNDEPKSQNDWHYERFVEDKVVGEWQFEKFQVYRRETVLPRVFTSTSYVVEKNDSEIIQKIYDPNFDLKTIILEKEPQLDISNNQQDIIIAKVVSYEPNQATFETNSDVNSLLYLSDVYDPSWNVYIDNKKSELLRANYALRAVAVPAGTHDVTFKYESKSQNLGLYVSTSSVLVTLVATIIVFKKRKF